MLIDTYDAVVGRLIDDPVLETSRVAPARFVVRIVLEARVPTSEVPREDAMPLQTMVATGPTALRAFEQFAEGDHFIAVGAARLAQCAGVGLVAGLVFEAWYLGHDLTRSRYAVDRTRRRPPAGSPLPFRRHEAIERELDLAAVGFPPRPARIP